MRQAGVHVLIRYRGTPPHPPPPTPAPCPTHSQADAKVRMRKFCESLSRPFHVRYDANTRSVAVDRAVKPVLTKVQSSNLEAVGMGAPAGM